MNIKHINRVIASIKGEVKRTEDLGLNMNAFITDKGPSLRDHSGRNCGTTACIAGHAYVLAHGSRKPNTAARNRPSSNIIIPEARKYLDLDNHTTHNLFYGVGAGKSLRNITAEEVIITLEILKETGEVDWSHTHHPVTRKGRRGRSVP